MFKKFVFTSSCYIYHHCLSSVSHLLCLGLQQPSPNGVFPSNIWSYPPQMYSPQSGIQNWAVKIYCVKPFLHRANSRWQSLHALLPSPSPWVTPSPPLPLTLVTATQSMALHATTSSSAQKDLFCLEFCSSVAQSCPTLCDPMDCSTTGFPVFHHLPELTQTHVHQVCDAIQPSHPLSSPSSPALNLSQHQGLFQWVGFSHQVVKVLELQLQHHFLQ